MKRQSDTLFKESGLKAIVLCAGRGKRMRELTAHNSKPLIRLWGRSMVDWQLDCLKKGGIREVVVNTAHFADLYPQHFADHPVEGIQVTISQEGSSIADALETKGGIVKALPVLSDGKEPFVVVSGDIVTAFDYASLEKAAERIRKGEVVGHLVLVPNPSFHDGDMTLKNGLISRDEKKYTYGNIAVFSPKIFAGEKSEFSKLFPWLYQFVDQHLVSGEIYEGPWANVGTPEELAKCESLDCFFKEAGLS